MRCKHIPLDTFKVDSGFHLLVSITTALDYEQSLFFLGPSSKTPVTRKWPCAWLKARYGSPRFSCRAASLLNARAWRKIATARSLLLPPNNYDQIVGSDYMKTTLEIDWSEFRPSDRCRRRRCDRYYLWKGTNDLTVVVFIWKLVLKVCRRHHFYPAVKSYFHIIAVAERSV